MWPWEHLALGYLAVSLIWRLGGRRVNDTVAVSVALGTQFPDLVDKPLAWYLGILPAARSLTHTALVAGPLSVMVFAIATYYGRSEWGLAFAVGYLSHLFGDALPKLIHGNYEGLTFLLWPVLPLPEYGGLGSVVVNLQELLTSPTAYLLAGTYRAPIIVTVIVLWADDGFPGVFGVGRYLTNTVRQRASD